MEGEVANGSKSRQQHGGKHLEVMRQMFEEPHQPVGGS